MYFLWLCGQGSVLWSFMGGIHRSPMKSPYTGQAVPRFSFNVISLDKLLSDIAKLLQQISIRYLSSYGIYTSANTSNFITRFYLWWQQTMQINTATVVANQATIVAQKLTFFAFHWSTSKSNLKSWRRHLDGFHQNVHSGTFEMNIRQVVSVRIYDIAPIIMRRVIKWWFILFFITSICVITLINFIGTL